MSVSLWKASYKSPNLEVALIIEASNFKNAKQKALEEAMNKGLTLYKLEECFKPSKRGRYRKDKEYRKKLSQHA